MSADGLTIPGGASHTVIIQNITPVHPQQTIPGSVQRRIPENEPENTSDNQASLEQKKLDPEFLAKITEEINEGFRIFNTSISFDVDKETGSTIIRILDRDTKKIIREIPPLEFLRLASRLAEIIGMLIDKTA